MYWISMQLWYNEDLYRKIKLWTLENCNLFTLFYYLTTTHLFTTFMHLYLKETLIVKNQIIISITKVICKIKSFQYNKLSDKEQFEEITLQVIKSNQMLIDGVVYWHFILPQMKRRRDLSGKVKLRRGMTGHRLTFGKTDICVSLYLKQI